MGRRNVDDELPKDVNVDIPENQKHRFGCSGRMWKLSRASMEAFIQKIPRGTRHGLLRHGLLSSCHFFCNYFLLMWCEHVPCLGSNDAHFSSTYAHSFA